MFSSFQKAEEFVRNIIRKTRSREIRWEINSFQGFIEKGGSSNPSFYIFVEEPPMLVLRDLSSDYDVVISSQDSPDHTNSLQDLYSAITRQIGLLF